ncbi:hypothetical protein BS47DRAFT_1338740 [Hydnum rufescens UP504]|uniref:Uncharacterized protein n=1 Tax=Hydnum rufescens UP504 TaxID=1448309 RepID=A0A9P6DY74_9AGAM|nr:hypothetical protein BS47DRAFT_1338740 [Hydnum rufescens UP504]
MSYPTRIVTTNNLSRTLLNLPIRLLHPPSHPNHVLALYCSLLSLRQCIHLNTDLDKNNNAHGDVLGPEMLCRAWTTLAEIGLLILRAGFGGDAAPNWCRGIEGEIEDAIAKGLHLSLAPKQSSLRTYHTHLMLLHSHLVLWQHNLKFSRSLMKRVWGSLSASDLPQTQYTALLSQHASYLSSVPVTSVMNNANKSSTLASRPSPVDINTALQIAETLRSLGSRHRHPDIVRLAILIKLRTLVRAQKWHGTMNPADQSIQGSLPEAESALGLVFDVPDGSAPFSSDPTERGVNTLLERMQMHVLVISVLYYTFIGDSKAASPRLSRLHQLLDVLALTKGADAFLTIPLTPGPPLIIEMSHPRVLFELGYIISSVSKRDTVGRDPRRKKFLAAGLLEINNRTEELGFPKWSSLADARELEDRLAKIKADFLCEMAGVCIMRSEFEQAEGCLAEVIAHTRTYSIFPFFAARITLHHAHLAHATTQVERALHYRSSSHNYGSGTSGFVRVAARAGEVGLRLGLRAIKDHTLPVSMRDTDNDLNTMACDVIEECRAYPGVLTAVGRLLEAITSKEIVKAKHKLKASLDIASRAQDNHLRAVVLALTSAHYYDTASDHAQVMLQTARQLAAGMGASETRGNVDSGRPRGENYCGNSPLGLWVGERFLELYRRRGALDKNETLRAAVRILPSRVRNSRVAIPLAV